MSDKKVEVPMCAECGALNKSIFCSLNKVEMAEVEEVKGCELYKKGEAIFEEGKYAKGIYCVSKGKVKLYQIGREGKEQIVRFARPGDLIGYRSILSDQALSATAETLEESAICFIPKDTLFKLIDMSPSFSLRVMKMACEDLGEATRIMTDLAQKTVKERLAEILLLLKETFGVDEEGYLDVKLTRAEISDMIGTATESAIRLLSDFNKQGIIATEGKRIQLRDIPALTAEAKIYD